MLVTVVLGGIQCWSHCGIYWDVYRWLWYWEGVGNSSIYHNAGVIVVYTRMVYVQCWSLGRYIQYLSLW